MAIHTLTLHDGSTLQVEAPLGTSTEELVSIANTQQSPGREERANKRQARQDEILGGAPMYEPQADKTGILGNLTKGFGAGFVGTGEMAALGAATLLEEDNEAVAREKIQSVSDAIKPKGGDPDDLTYKIGQTFGSIAGFAAPVALAGALAPAAGTAATATGIGALLGVGTAAGEASERARAGGATQEERNTAIRTAAPSGLLEVLPLGRFMRSVDVPVIGQFIKDLGPETVETIGERISNAAITGGAEAAQEVTSEIVQNLVERGYNPDRVILEGTGESALLGGGAGATIQFLVDAFTNSRKMSPDSTAATQLGDEALQLPSPDAGIAGLLEPPREEAGPKPDGGRGSRTRALKEMELAGDIELLNTLQEDSIVEDIQADEMGGELSETIAVPKLDNDKEDVPTALRQIEEDLETIEATTPQTQPTRRVVLNNVLENTPITDTGTAKTAKTFSKTLEAVGLPDTKPTKIERKLIARRIREAKKGGVKPKQPPLGQPIRPIRPTPPALEQPSPIPPSPVQPPTPAPPVLGQPPVAPTPTPPVISGQPPSPTPAMPAAPLTPATPIAPQVMPPPAPEGMPPPSPETRFIAPSTPAPIPATPLVPSVEPESAPVAPTPRPIDEAFLNELGIPPFAPIRQRVLGKDFNSLEVRDQFKLLAANKNIPNEVKENINRELNVAPSVETGFDRDTLNNRLTMPEGDFNVGTSNIQRDRIGSESIKPSVEKTKNNTKTRTKKSKPSNNNRLASSKLASKNATNRKRAQSNPLTKNIIHKQTQEIRGKLKQHWDSIVSESRKETYDTNTDSAKNNPFTTPENNTILELLHDPRRRKTLSSVVAYLELFPNPAQGIRLAMVEVATNQPQIRGHAALKGTGGDGASKTIAWVEKNLSRNSKEWLRQAALEVQAELNTVANADIPIGRLKERNVSDPIQVSKDKSALQAQQEENDVALEGVDAQDFKVEEQLNLTATKVKKLLEANAVVGLDLPQHPFVTSSIRAGELEDALTTLSTTSPSKQVREVAKKLANVVGSTKLNTKTNLRADDGTPVAGLFDPTTNTITLDSKNGVNTHALLHEMTHAAASATLANKTHPFSKQIINLYEDTKEYLDTVYGSESVDEFFSESMSNPEFRAKLATINVKGEPVSSFQQFLNIVGNFVRKLMGASVTPVNAAEAVDSFVDGILAPAPAYRNSGQLLMRSTPDGVKRVAKDLVDKTQKTIGTSQGRKEFGQKFADNSIEFLQSSVADRSKNFLLRLAPSQGIADIAKAAGFEGLGFKLDKIINEQRGSIRIANENVQREVSKVVDWVRTVSPEKKETLDRLIYNDKYGATIYQVDPLLTEEGAKKKYANDAEKLDVWKEQRKDWNALGIEGKRTYKLMRDSYRAQYEKLRDVIYGEIDSLIGTNNPEAAEKLRNNVYAKLFDKGALDVYFPLVREGQYKLTYAVKNPTSPREAYIVEMFNTKRERDRAAAEVRADKAFTSIETFDKEMTRKDFKNAPPSSFVAETLRTLSANGVDEDVQNQIMQLFINVLPETSFAKSLQKRKGTPGYMTDSVYAMKAKAYDIAGQTEKLRYGAILRAYEREVIEQVEPVNEAKAKSRVGKAVEATRASFDQVKNELLDRAQFARAGAKNKNIEQYGRRFNQTAFIYTIGFNASSALVNLSQIPLFVMPFLGGRYGYKETGIAIKEASSLVTSSQNSILGNYDLQKNGNVTVKKDLKVTDERRQELEDIAPLVSTAAKRGQLGQGYLAEALGLDESGRVSRGTKRSLVMDKVAVLSAYMFNAGEQFNRQVTLVSSYKLALEKLTKDNPKMTLAERGERAAEQAIYITQETNGGAFLETGPTIAREGFGRVMFMYKSFGLQMYYTMLKTAKTAIDSDKSLYPEERRIAIKQLIGIHGSALFFAGIQGLPLYGAMQLLADLFFLDDEEDDFDTIVRKHVGEGWYKGAITEYIGIDVASRTALTGLLIQENRYNYNASLEENIGHYFGGPALSVGKRFLRGVDDLKSGEVGSFERGIENVLPVAIANAYKASFGRYQTQGGIFTRRGDPIYDDITGGELVAQALGFPPTEYTFRQEQNSASKRIDIAVGKERSRLHKQYYVASTIGDYTKVQDIYNDMMKFNKRHPEASITGKSINKSIKMHMKTSSEMYNGIRLNSLYRDTLESMRSEYSQ